MNDGKVYQGVDGTWYYIQCCSTRPGLFVSYDVAASANNCKLYGLGGYSTVHKPGVHHHYATDPPTVAANLFDTKRCSTECPEADGQIFASPTGENFIMSCKKRHGTTYLKQAPDRYPSFASCMKACGSVPACLSVDYEAKTQSATSAPTRRCPPSRRQRS
ncbi:pan domain containing protein [Apiospora arundinis]